MSNKPKRLPPRTEPWSGEVTLDMVLKAKELLDNNGVQDGKSTHYDAETWEDFQLALARRQHCPVFD